MSKPGHNPYAPPLTDEFVATSYDQYNQLPQQAPTTGVYAPQQQAQLQESYELQDQSNLVFFNEVDDIKRNLVQYEDNIERIEGLHKRSLAESNLADECIIQRQLDGLQADTRGLAENLKSRIKQLEATSQRDSTKNAQTQNLKHQFMGMIQKFQATEAAFRQRYRDTAARQYRIVEPEASEAEIQEAVDDPAGQIFSQALMNSNRRGDARTVMAEVQQRHREVAKIEATMTELAQLFHDMEIMVAEQDTQITAIQENVHGAGHDIEAGVDNQFVAIKKAKAWRRKKWACAIILGVIILFCILFFAIYFGRK